MRAVAGFVASTASTTEPSSAVNVVRASNTVAAPPELVACFTVKSAGLTVVPAGNEMSGRRCCEKFAVAE